LGSKALVAAVFEASGGLGDFEQPGVSDCVVEASCALLGLDHDRKEWSGRDYASALRERFSV